MKRYIRHIILLTALFVVAVGVGVSITTAASTSIQWYDYNDGMILAKEQNKPSMIDFGADRCGACRKLDEETFTDGRVIALSKVSSSSRLTQIKKERSWTSMAK
jgi:Protein of unknown function, DUF255.